MAKNLQIIVLMGLGLLAACSNQKQPAEAAFASVEASVAGVRADLEQYAPEQFAELTEAIDGMKAKLNAKDYAGALADQSGIMQKLSATSSAAAANKNEKLKAVATIWRALIAEVPPHLEKLGTHVRELSTSKGKLPNGTTREALLNVEGALPDLAASWGAAAEAARQGNLPVAVDRGREIQQRVNQLAASVGLQF